MRAAGVGVLFSSRGLSLTQYCMEKGGWEGRCAFDSGRDATRLGMLQAASSWVPCCVSRVGTRASDFCAVCQAPFRLDCDGVAERSKAWWLGRVQQALRCSEPEKHDAPV